MAQKTSRADKYPSVYVDSVTLSAANTLTTREIVVGLNIFDKVALLVSRFEIEPGSAAIGEMTATGDVIAGGLVNSAAPASLAMSDQNVVDLMSIIRHDLGAAAAGVVITRPLVHDFSTLPGGGLLVPPKPLYFAGASSGLASAATIIFRMYFVIVQLTDAEYLELLETRRAFN